ncbi:MAG: hypothetical protein PHC70_01750 [Patescibacteria group bacterium]|nr:hypothetical protein [Patescibacteria group bacterium]
MKAISIALGSLSGGMHILAFWLYYRQMLLGTSRPKAASWLLWPLLTTLNCVLYLLSTGDWIKSILPIASTAASLVIVTVALKRKHLDWPKLWELIIMMAAVNVAILYLIFKSEMTSSLLMQACIVISFVPTIVGVAIQPRSERPTPWFIWASAYVLTLMVVLLRWRGQPSDLVYPTNCFILHAIVGLLTFRKPVRAAQDKERSCP